MRLLLIISLCILPACLARAAAPNLALSGNGGVARSWEPGAVIIAGQETSKANDGRLHSYWSVRPEDLPADLGLEWPQTQTISSVVVRYFDGRMVRGPAVARQQEWARLQYWRQNEWQDIEAEVVGQETASVRYSFPPVKTTRIRLLFTEPPDPEARRTPERLGIFVCELEAFRARPYKIVDAPGGLQRRTQRRGEYWRAFNEPPTGDANFEMPGPLVIEPRQTRIFTDTLRPTLIVKESRWARERCRVEKDRPGTVSLKNGFLELDIATAPYHETRIANLVTGESISTPRAKPFAIRTATGELSANAFKVAEVDTSRSDDDAARVRIRLTSEYADLTVHYELRRQDHFFHKWLEIANKAGAPLEVRDVTVSWLDLPRPLDLMAGQELTYPISRLQKGGFFSCLETVYWVHKGDALTYYPGVTVAPGQTLVSEKAVVGVYRNRGEMAVGFDHGVREWVVEYHAQVSPLPPAWPDVYCEAWSARFGVKEIREHPEWSERFMDVARRLGIRYMDMYEATHDAAAMPDDWLRQLMDLAGRNEIATGFWTDFGSNQDFAGLGIRVKPHACKLSADAEGYLRKVVAVTRKYKFRAMHWGDFLAVWPCQETGHGHLPGKYSIYPQGQRILRFAEELREASPGLMLGADGGFTNPQYVRHADSRAHGIFYGGLAGDHWPSVDPDIHLDRLYADMNRVWVSGGYSIFLRPWFRMINGVNHFGQETHTHDRAGYRYGLLSALAMAAQVTFNDVPVDMPESEITFTRKWLDWARSNQVYLKQGDRLFERSPHFADEWQGDAEALSGFSHIRGDHGYVFLLNPSPVEQIADLGLALDTLASQRFAVDEVFPGGMSLAGDYRQGGKLRVTVPAKQVRILWIGPDASRQPARPEDARAAEWRRYVDEWIITERTPENARLRAAFAFPENGKDYLVTTAAESDWSKEPWGYDKAYMVFLLKDENGEQNSNWVPDKPSPGATPAQQATGLTLAVWVNGVSRTVHAFKTKRMQQAGVTRCHFVDLGGEVKPGQLNTVEVLVPVRTGLVFSGAYLDLPNQIPLGTDR